MDRNQYSRRPQFSFPTLTDWRITMGYGVMREGEHVVIQAMDSCELPMPMAFVVHETQFRRDGLLGFAECSSRDMLRTVFRPGQRAKLCFQAPQLKEENGMCFEPDGWNVETVPPLPGIDCPGNITFIVYPTKDDEQQLHVAHHPLKEMKMTKLWLFPLTEDLTWKRMLNGVDQLAEDQNGLLSRIVLGNDLSDTHDIPLIEDVTEVQDILGMMNTNQEEIFHSTNDSR